MGTIELILNPMQNMIVRGVLNLWGLVCAVADSLLRPFRRVGVVGVVGVPALIEPIAPIAPIAPILPIQAGREVIKIYPGVRGFSKPQRAKAEKTLKTFHEAVKEKMWKIEDTNRHYGVSIKPTPMGNGLFNGGEDVPKGKVLFVYIAVLSEVGQQNRDKDTSYLFDYGPFIGFDCVADAKFTVAAMQTFNGAFLNHKCVKANCKGRWVYNSGEWYLEFFTAQTVQAGMQFTISYNDHNPKEPNKHPYLVPVNTLSHLPPGQVVKCLCAHPDECPKKMGFDRMVIYGRPNGECHKYGQA